MWTAAVPICAWPTTPEAKKCRIDVSGNAGGTWPHKAEGQRDQTPPGYVGGPIAAEDLQRGWVRRRCG